MDHVLLRIGQLAIDVSVFAHDPRTHRRAGGGDKCLRCIGSLGKQGGKAGKNEFGHMQAGPCAG
jgi:hypothetical protein